MIKIVADFQRKNGLEPDGSIGPLTLSKMKSVWSLTNENLAHFLGQCDHESNGFTELEENLNYSKDRLLQIFKSDFDKNHDRVLSDVEKQKANELIGHPDKIANFVYANQNGNGNEASGDGWKHRGFGPLQLTGKSNQDAFANWIKDPQVKIDPSLIAIKYPFESALFYFEMRKLWPLCIRVNTTSIINVSKVINLGNIDAKGTPIGLNHRIERTNYYYKLLTQK